jgi:hypothetical protein
MDSGKGYRRMRTPNDRKPRGTIKTIDNKMNSVHTITSVNSGLANRSDKRAEMMFANVTSRILTIAETLTAAAKLTPQAKAAFRMAIARIVELSGLGLLDKLSNESFSSSTESGCWFSGVSFSAIDASESSDCIGVATKSTCDAKSADGAGEKFQFTMSLLKRVRARRTRCGDEDALAKLPKLLEELGQGKLSMKIYPRERSAAPTTLLNW